MSGDSLTLSMVPVGDNGSATLTAQLNGDVLAVEKLDLARPKARAAFRDRLCADRPGIDRESIDAELLRMAAEIANRRNGPPTVSAEADEIDVSRIVRPELFLMPEVSGITIPTITTVGGSPMGQWMTYLRWRDGRRECRPLMQSLDLPGHIKLWIMPTPSAPSPKLRCGWSATARRSWLSGAPAPNAADVFRRVCERIAHYADFPGDRAAGTTATLALWSMLTYCYPSWDAVPYLYVGGPAGSGKSRVFEILQRLVFRPFVSSSVTGPTVFRTLHEQGGALLFDEAEQLKRSNDPSVGETLSVFLAGYKRGGQATRLEPCGDSFRLVAFDVFGPKALACINGLPPALASRCIALMMFRAAKGSDKPKRRIDADPVTWANLRDDLHGLAMEHGPTLLALADRTDVCPAMRGRDHELWQPLLALAEWVESEGAKGLLSLMRDFALESIDAGQDDVTPDTDETLLRTLADMLRMGERPTPQAVLDKAREADPEALKRWGPRGVSSVLKRYGILTYKSHGRKLYGEAAVPTLRSVQTTYGIDLGYPDDDAA